MQLELLTNINQGGGKERFVMEMTRNKDNGEMKRLLRMKTTTEMKVTQDMQTDNPKKDDDTKFKPSSASGTCPPPTMPQQRRINRRKTRWLQQKIPQPEPKFFLHHSASFNWNRNLLQQVRLRQDWSRISSKKLSIESFADLREFLFCPKRLTGKSEITKVIFFCLFKYYPN